MLSSFTIILMGCVDRHRCHMAVVGAFVDERRDKPPAIHRLPALH